MGPEFTVSVRTTTSLTGSAGGGESFTSVAGSVEWVTIIHGTDQVTADGLKEDGVDHARMLAYYPQAYAFCTTTCIRTAKQYATLNNAVQMNGAVPALFSAKIPAEVVHHLLREMQVIEVLEDRALEFLPGSFATLNAEMTDRTVTLAADLKFDD
jgi:hypothetical protein